MSDRIVNIENYSQKVHDYFASILEGRLLLLDVDKLNDKELLSSLPTGRTDPSRGLCFANNICSWFTIGESRELEFIRPYKQMCLVDGDKPIYINYSRFWLPLNIYSQDNKYFRNQSGVNTIDGLQIEPESFFHDYIGEKLFFIYGRKGVDQFGRKQNCLLFAHKKVSPNDIRRYIITSQLYTMQEVINNPVEYSILPDATIVSEWNGLTKKNCNIVGHPLIYELVDRIYKEEFLYAFNAKYKNLLSKYERIMSFAI